MNPLLNLGFEIGTETSHITQSRRTVGKYAVPGKTAENYYGAIGFDGETVQGTDILVPTFQFTQQRILPIETVTFGFVRALFYLTGRFNSGAFLGFEAGEVLFLGAGGTRNPEGDWDLTYRFSASPNAKNLTVGKIRGINKRGWDHLWVRYVDDVDQKVLVKVPSSAYVEEVIQPGNFNIGKVGIDQTTPGTSDSVTVKAQKIRWSAVFGPADLLKSGVSPPSLKNLANDANKLSGEWDNTDNDFNHLYALLQLKCRGAAAFDASGEVKVWILPAVDGTGF